MGETDLIGAPIQVLAVDPGLSGAVCKLGRGVFKVRRDFKTLLSIAQAIQELAPGADSAVMEFVHSRPGEGTVSVFSFGRSTGIAFGSLFTAGFGVGRPLEEIHPVRWQNFFRQLLCIPKDTLFDSPAIATTLLPSQSAAFSRKKDHGTADAALMAIYRVAQTPLLASQPMSPNLLQRISSVRSHKPGRPLTEVGQHISPN